MESGWQTRVLCEVGWRHALRAIVVGTFGSPEWPLETFLAGVDGVRMSSTLLGGNCLTGAYRWSW